MADGSESSVIYQCVRGTDIKARYRVVSQSVPKFAEQTFYGTVLSRTDLNSFQSHLELMWDGFDDPEVVMVHWIDPTQYDPEKAIMGLAPLYRAKAEPKVRSRDPAPCGLRALNREHFCLFMVLADEGLQRPVLMLTLPVGGLSLCAAAAGRDH
jgi:hypothetical protein